MLFLALTFGFVVIVSYVDVVTKRSNGMEEYCRLECKGYKY